MNRFRNRAALWRVLQLTATKLAIALICPTLLAFASFEVLADQTNVPHEVRTLKITVLATNLAGNPNEGDGEWGYSALVEVDGHKILYDTGASADMIVRNAAALHIDLSDVQDVILSHNHWDHVGL